MDATESSPTPTSVNINSRSGYIEAIDQVISRSSRTLRVFEYNLEGGGFNTSARFDLLRGFLLKNRQNRMMIILHDIDYLLRYCPRMITLLTQFSHAISINAISAEAKGIYDPFVIGDERHFIHRFHYDSPRALLGLDDAPSTHPLLGRFEEIWAASTSAVFSSTLGL